MSMIEGTHHHADGAAVLAADEWTEQLSEESVRLHALGIRAGLISMDFSAAPDAEVWRDRAVRLLRRSLQATDRIGLTSSTSLAILHTPLRSVPELQRLARQIDTHLKATGLVAAIGFAHRRAGEDLMDTYARSDAQADRATFRQQYGSGGDLILS